MTFNDRERKPVRIRLPGFIGDDIALGDAMKRTTRYMGFKPCGGCEKRAAVLNRWIVFSGARRK